MSDQKFHIQLNTAKGILHYNGLILKEYEDKYEFKDDKVGTCILFKTFIISIEVQE